MKNKIYKLDSIIDFGKHKGKTIEDVIIENVTYIEWAIGKIKWFNLDEKAKLFCKKYLDRYNQYCYQKYLENEQDMYEQYDDYSWHDAYDTYMYGKND